MCTTEELHRSIIALSGDLKFNSEAQQATQLGLARLETELDTWQKTRCEDHHEQIETLRTKVNGQGTAMAETAGRAAGNRAGWIGAGLIVMNVMTLLFAYLKVFQPVMNHISGG